MSDIQLYLLDADKHRDDALARAQATAKKLEAKETKLVELVESLGEFLNNEDVAVRVNTMAYLADVLVAVRPKVLTTQQRDLLAEFVLSRVANGAEGLGHCARSLLALERLAPFTPDRVRSIVNTWVVPSLERSDAPLTSPGLLDNTHPLVRFKQQSDRFAILTLLDTVMVVHRTVLKAEHESSKDFMSRFISYFDGEKDPRNLMVVFSILLVPMAEWDVSADAQDLFESVFNYFPITFRPPPDDPYGITAQQLKDRLRDCIAANGAFAPHAFPALLDKLDSTSLNVKRDVIQAIEACAANYGPATMNLYSITLWDSLKFEILSAEEEDLAAEALVTLRAIALQLASSTHIGPLTNYIKPITKECNEHLEDAPTKQSSAAGKILSSIASAAPEASASICKAVLPHLFALLKSADTIARRRGLLEVLTALIKSNVLTYGRWRKTGAADLTEAGSVRTAPNGFEDAANLSVDTLAHALTASPPEEVSFRLLALEGLCDLASVDKLLDDATIGQIIRMLDHIVIEEVPYGKDEVKAAAIDSLVAIAHQKPQLVIDISIPEFMTQLPDNDRETTSKFVPALEAFAKLSAEQQIFDTLITRLKNRLSVALHNAASSKYVLAIFSAVLFAFSHGAVALDDPNVFSSYYQDIVIPFIANSVAVADTTAGEDEHRGQIAMELVGRISNVIIRKQPAAVQADVARNIYILFREAEVQELAPFRSDRSDPAIKGSPSTMIISTHIMAALQREAMPHLDVGELLLALIDCACHPKLGDLTIGTAIRQISLLMNKFLPPAMSASVIGPLFAGRGSPLSEDLSLKKIRINLAILKALVLRTDPAVGDIIPSFLSLLEDDAFGTPVARAFSSVLAPDDLLTKENHCIIYSLHKQRFFNLTVPAITSSFASAKPAIKTNYLVALSGILYWIPYSLLRQELTRLVPLLLQSLSLDDLEVKANTVATFSRIIQEDATLVENHVSSLIARLLAIGATTGSSAADGAVSPDGASETSAKTRAAALACLSAFAVSFKAETILPHKHEVVKALALALDDNKRAVRAEAVRCRVNWAALGDGDDDD